MGGSAEALYSSQRFLKSLATSYFPVFQGRRTLEVNLLINIEIANTFTNLHVYILAIFGSIMVRWCGTGECAKVIVQFQK